MAQLYKLIKDYNGFAKDAVITVASGSRLKDMNSGYGVLYVEPEPEVIEPEVIEPEVEIAFTFAKAFVNKLN